jgi:hypothetical protein
LKKVRMSLKAWLASDGASIFSIALASRWVILSSAFDQVKCLVMFAGHLLVGAATKMPLLEREECRASFGEGEGALTW